MIAQQIEREGAKLVGLFRCQVDEEFFNLRREQAEHVAPVFLLGRDAGPRECRPFLDSFFFSVFDSEGIEDGTGKVGERLPIGKRRGTKRRYNK